MSSRMRIVAGVLGVGLVVLCVRLVQLSVVRVSALAERAADQYRQRVTVAPRRGAIVDRNARLLAFSTEGASLYVRPAELPAPRDTPIRLLADQLALPTPRVDAALNAAAPFVWLRRGVSPDVAQRVKALKLPGVYSLTTQRRVYPHARLGAALLGFVDVDARGLEGLEAVYDGYLLRAAARSLGERDARGRTMFVQGGPQQPETFQLRLALDTRLQYIAQRELERAVHDSGARAGSVVVLDPRTFAVLALAQLPSFDPNRPAEFAADARRNRVVSDCYEPGSTLKALVVAATLDARQATEVDHFFCENGAYRVGGHTIHDVRPHAELRVDQILSVSSNIGAAKLGERLGAERYLAYLRAFGLGQPTGVDLPGEIGGILPGRPAWSRIKLVTASFGQGVAVTPLQLACAYGVLANDGVLMRPYVVSEVVNSKGDVVHANRPTPVRQVIRPETARRVRALLERVVEPGGTGWRAQIPGFRVAGKTGTSQKVDPRGGYSATGRVASFIGMVPAAQPRLLILVVVDEPQGVVSGGAVAAPAFQVIARQSLATLGVTTDPDGTPTAERVQRAGLPAVEAVEKTVRVVAGVPSTGHGATATSPDFIGLSLRAAMRKAAVAGVRTLAHGSGYVTQQVVHHDTRTDEPIYELTLEAGW